MSYLYCQTRLFYKHTDTTRCDMHISTHYQLYIEFQFKTKLTNLYITVCRYALHNYLVDVKINHMDEVSLTLH